MSKEDLSRLSEFLHASFEAQQVSILGHLKDSHMRLERQILAFAHEHCSFFAASIMDVPLQSHATTEYQQVRQISGKVLQYSDSSDELRTTQIGVSVGLAETNRQSQHPQIDVVAANNTGSTETFPTSARSDNRQEFDARRAIFMPDYAFGREENWLEMESMRENSDRIETSQKKARVKKSYRYIKDRHDSHKAYGLRGLRNESETVRLLLKIRAWHCFPQKLKIWSKAITSNTRFSAIVTFLIIINAFFMAYDVSSYMDRSYERWRTQMTSSVPVKLKAADLWMSAVDLIFATAFTMELVLRIISDETQFFVGEFSSWNALDLLVVIFSWVEIIADSVASDEKSSTGMPPLRLLRLLRMLRSLRVVRALRFFVELRLVLLSLLHSCVPLLWCSVVLLLMMFVFSTFFMQVLGSCLGDYTTAFIPDPSHWAVKLETRFGSSRETMLTLLAVITGGDDWMIVHTPIKQASPLVAWVFVAYIIIMALGVLNVISAVFVEGALSKAKGDRQLTLVQNQEKDRATARELMDEFKNIDSDGSSDISLEEWVRFCEGQEGRDFLKLANFDESQTEELFRILDIDDSGRVNMEEFVAGLMSIHGQVNKVDMQAVIRYNRKAFQKCLFYMEMLSAGSQRITDVLARIETAALQNTQVISEIPPVLTDVKAGNSESQYTQSI